MITKFLNKNMLIVLLAASNCAAADNVKTSFNCNAAANIVDQLICSDKKLTSLDNAMTNYYNQLKQAYKINQAKNLLHEQRNWLKSRAIYCHIPTSLKKVDPHTSLDQQHYISCLTDYYRLRNYTLFKRIYNPENKNNVTTITGSLDFSDFSFTGLISLAEINQLYHVPIIADVDRIGIEDSNTRSLHNCDDYNNSPSIDASSTLEIGEAATIGNTCEILDKLRQVKKPNKNFLNQVDLSDINYFSLDFLTSFNEADNELFSTYRKKNLTLNDLIKQGEVKFEIRNPTSIAIKHFIDHELNTITYIEEIARGDFNGDGNDGILTLITNHSGGTESISNLNILTLNSAGKLTGCSHCQED